MAAFGVPLAAGAWAWNRLRQKPGWPLAVTSVLGGLLLFEICTLLALGGIDRWAWAGAWGLAASMALRSALGGVGSWIVAGALFGVTALAASEFGFHWITHLAHRAVMTPASGVAGLIRTWREEREKALAKPRIRQSKPQTKPQEEKAQKPRIATAIAAGGGPGVGVSGELEDDGQFRLPLPGLKRIEKPKPQPAPRNAPASESSAGALEPSLDPLPSLSLLGMPTQPEDLVTAADLTTEANLLLAKLADFGIEGRVTEIHPGPGRDHVRVRAGGRASR